MSPEVRERILIIEDERLIRFALRSRLEREHYEVAEAETGAKGRELVQSFRPDLVLLDFRLPDASGLDILREIVVDSPEVVVILMTAFSTVENAVLAMRLGAFMYVNKPFDQEELMLHVKKGLERTALRREVDRLRQSTGSDDSAPMVIAESPEMRALLETIKRVNEVASSTILLRGENGTGKDVLARLIHATSRRAKAAFQNITCTALPDQLLESELFGYERGAFTDAKARKSGLLELAHGGTVFLDEIGDMSVNLQGKLLRFLEEKAIRRVGGTADIRVDVRILAATNRDLESAVRDGQFRQDLYYRLAVIPLVVPSLRSRPADILPLASLFIDRYNREFRRSIRGLTKGAEAALLRHAWPGNVRELRNVIERAMILTRGDRLDLGDLPSEVASPASLAPVFPVSSHPADIPVATTATLTEVGAGRFHLPPDGLVLADVERDLVQQALDRAEGNQTKAAKLLGISRDQLRYRLEKFHLE